MPEIVGTMEHQAHGGITTQSAFAGYIVPANIPVSERGGQSRIDGESETFIVTEITGTLCASGAGSERRGATDDVLDTCVAHALRADGFDASEDGTGRGTPLVPVAFNARQDPIDSRDCALPLDTDGSTQAVAFSCKDHGSDAGDICPTLRAMEYDGSHANGGGQVAVAFAQNTRDEVRLQGRDGQISGALGREEGMKQRAFIAFQESQTGCREYESAGTLRSNGPGHDPVGTRVRQGMAVRRLTPTECERLQGFPDSYTLIPHRGKPAADGPRYRALGNSMAVPVMRWIGRRIMEANKER